MKEVACGIAVGSGLLAMGDVFPWFSQPIIQSGALAILAWTIWYLLTRTIPFHTKALRDERDAFLTAQREERKGFRKSLKKLAKALQQLNN